MNANPPRPKRILQIAACAVPGEKRTFANVYGLDDEGNVWQWNARDGAWQPNVIPEQQEQPRRAFR